MVSLPLCQDLISCCRKSGLSDPLCLFFGEEKGHGFASHLWEVRFHPSGKFCVICKSDSILYFVGISQDGSMSVKGTLDTGAIQGEGRTIRSVDFSPCGEFLATGSFGSNVAIWRNNNDSFEECIYDWRHVATLEGHENEVKSVRWSKAGNGSFLATCGRDKSVWIWEQLNYLAAADRSNSNDEQIEFECLAVLQEHGQDVKSLAWHPRRSLLASCSYDGTVRLWKQDEMEEDWLCCDKISLGDATTVWDVAFSPAPNSGLLAAVTEEGELYLIAENCHSEDDEGRWDLLRIIDLMGIEGPCLSFPGPLYSLAFGNGNTIVLSPCSLKHSDLIFIKLGPLEENDKIRISSLDRKKLEFYADNCHCHETLSKDINGISVFLKKDGQGSDLVAAVSDNNTLTVMKI